jgi:hypothetical protein
LSYLQKTIAIFGAILTVMFWSLNLEERIAGNVGDISADVRRRYKA